MVGWLVCVAGYINAPWPNGGTSLDIVWCMVLLHLCVRWGLQSLHV